MYVNIIKPVYNKPLANIILNGGKTETITSKAGSKIKVSLSSLLFFDSLPRNKARGRKKYTNRKGRSLIIPTCL
jgi:hypothetical protein